MRGFLLVLACLAALPTYADEECGHSITSQEHGKAALRADITPAWLDHVRLSTIRLTNCTASFVSPGGLILTNHHCVESCLAELSSKDKSLVELGFAAADRSAETGCPHSSRTCWSVPNVTDTIAKAIAGLSDAAANDARKRTQPRSNRRVSKQAPKRSPASSAAKW